MRKERDATLGAPRLLFASLQVNMRNGELPPPVGGTVFLVTPVTDVAPASH
jgi:hypothetical protein